MVTKVKSFSEESATCFPEIMEFEKNLIFLRTVFIVYSHRDKSYLLISGIGILLIFNMSEYSVV